MALCEQPSTEIEMTGDNKLDGAERADLLCFLVMAQLIGHATTGDWLERAKLARMAADIAPTFLTFPCFRDAKELVKLLADGWQLDYRSPTVRGMLDVCAEHLLSR
jgi:hypothetical protein